MRVISVSIAVLLLCIVVFSFTYRRRTSNKVSSVRNSRVGPASNMYEMSNDEAKEPGYAIIQSGASAPAQSTNPIEPSRSSVHNDVTLVENDLYEKSSNHTIEMEQGPTTVSNVPAPPVYAVVRKNRATGGFFVQSESCAPVADTAAGDMSTNATNPTVDTHAADNDTAQHLAPPARSSLYEDLTLIDNDLYA